MDVALDAMAITRRTSDMNGQVGLITGALTGIGRAAAVAFAKKGAKVVVAGRRDEVGQALAKELRSLGSEAEFVNADVRKDEDVRALVDKTVARFGRLDVAVNNAGTEGHVGPIKAFPFALHRPGLRKGVDYSDRHAINAQYISSGGRESNGYRGEETQHLL
jgi:NAD(P)-dependent dehydrogenase (short-subunit alcohol dehydrogenase family)